VIDEPIRTEKGEIRIVGTGISRREPGHCRVITSGDFPILDLTQTENRRITGWHLRDFVLGAASVEQNPHIEGELSADLVKLHNVDDMRIENVGFDGEATTGNGIYALKSWDHKFLNTKHSRAGAPDTESADIYLDNDGSGTNNSWHFTNCRFERINSRAIYSKPHSESWSNHSFRFNQCKFHGHPESSLRSPSPHISGKVRWWHIVDSMFAWTNGGFIDLDGLYVTIRGARCLGTFGKPAIQLHSTFSTVSDCFFQAFREQNNQDPPYTPAIRSTGKKVTLCGNHSNGHGVRLQDARENLVYGNQVLSHDAAIRSTASSERNGIALNMLSGSPNTDLRGSDSLSELNL
jgi:hypothetical protein